MGARRLRPLSEVLILMLMIYIRKKLKLKPKLLPKLLLRRILILRTTRIKILASKRVSRQRRQRRKMWKIRKMRKMRTILLNILLWIINRDFNTMLRPTIVQIYAILPGYSWLTGLPTGLELLIGNRLVSEVRFGPNQTNYITAFIIDNTRQRIARDQP